MIALSEHVVRMFIEERCDSKTWIKYITGN